MARKLKITQTKSASGHPSDQRATVVALGIRRMQHTVVHQDTFFSHYAPVWGGPAATDGTNTVH